MAAVPRAVLFSRKPTCRNDCARFSAGTVSAITWEALARPPSQAYFFFAAFFLAFFFAFAMLALQVVGLVRGRSIYTRNKITSKRARNCDKCDRRSHR